jgi:hypothetical protein
MNKPLSAGVSTTLDLLFGDKLIEISTPALVERYNIALRRLGIEETTLRNFRIDQMGWSPEIALKREDPYYLCAGLANPMAVVLTPDQRNAPMLFPFHSYDSALFRQYFTEHSAAIADITAADCLGLYLDKEVSTFFSPEDLLLIRYIIVRTVAGELPQQAQAQKALVDRFLQEPLGWFDRSLRSDLIESARLNGDMRNRDLTIPDMHFVELQNFYTRAFGGVFVLRGLAHHTHLMIIEDKALATTTQSASSRVFHVHDQSLLDILITEELLELNLDWYCVYPEKLQEQLQHLELHLLCQSDPELDPSTLNPAQKARKLLKLQSSDLELFHELERLIRQLENGKVPLKSDNSDALNRLLMRPGLRIDESNHQVIEGLLCRLGLRSPKDLFRYDPGYFVEQYSQWPNSMKRYALGQIGIQSETLERSAQ